DTLAASEDGRSGRARAAARAPRGAARRAAGAEPGPASRGAGPGSLGLASPRAAPHVRDAHAGGRRGSAGDPGVSGASEPVDDAALHASVDRALAPGLRSQPSARARP